MTAGIKAKLRRKNRLMRAGRVEEADALAVRIGKDIASRNKTRLSHIDSKVNAKDMWAAYRQLTGRKQQVNAVDGITAESLNQHYVAISTDTSYQPPPCKHTAAPNVTEVVSEWRMFNILDSLCATATGLDQLPSWFLRLGAPLFYKPLTHLFNVSVSGGVIPHQWKAASISPVPKVSSPASFSDFRPISITSVLSRAIERLVVRQFIYPALLTPPPSLVFNDQFAFRPSGSTTAAVIAILQTVTNLLSDHPYVIVISLDFSKAFDTVRHTTLLQKFAQLDIPDAVYNWLVEYFASHSHCTKYGGSTSPLCQISASIVQGSAIGPVSYVVNASDLKAVTSGNELCKYADDTYVIIPAANEHSRCAELDHIQHWAKANNLTLNRQKSKEIIVTLCRRSKRAFNLPPCLSGIERVTSLKILGVTITGKLSMSEHVCDVVLKCAQSLHVINVLRRHGMNDHSLQAVYRSVVLAKLLYASSAWWGFTTADDRHRIEAVVRRGVRAGLYPANGPTAAQLVEDYDDTLFSHLMNSEQHVLHHLLPAQSDHQYNLRPRPHNLSLSYSMDHRNFIPRLVFKDTYCFAL